MFYVLTENRVLTPYRPQQVVEKTSASEKATEVDEHPDKNSNFKSTLHSALKDPPAEEPPRNPSGAIRAYEEQLESSAPKHPLTVDALMTSPVMTFSENERVDEAKRIMKETGFRHFPVLGLDGLLVGIITDRDLISHEDGWVSEYMCRKVLTASPKARLRQVVALMLQEKISCLPVMESNRKLIGILTTTDILKSLILRSPVEIWR